MTKEKAIEILKRQRDKLDIEKHTNDEAWIFQTAEYIRQFFGENSTQFSFISQFKWHVLRSPWDSNELVKHWLDQKPKEAKQFLDNCIESLNDTGLYQPPKTNFFQGYSNIKIIAAFVPVVTVAISIGLFFGQNKLDRDKLNLIEQNKVLVDSLSLFTIPLTKTDSNTNHNEDTTHRTSQNTKPQDIK